MYQVNMDLMGRGQSQGQLAQAFQTNGRSSVGSMKPYLDKKGRPCISVFQGGDVKDVKNYKIIQVNAATLRKDEWKEIDTAVMKVSESRLKGIKHLRDRGLVKTLGNGFATTVLENTTSSDALEAVMSMNGKTRGKNDRQVFNTSYTPIPIIHVDYEIDARTLAASRMLGNGIDTTNAERAGRKVSEHLESLLFTNTSYKFGGGAIYSYLNYPDRSTVALGTPWNDSAKTGEGMVDDVLKMKQKMLDNFHYGPFMVYIPSAYETIIDGDYDSTRGNTIRERILKISGVEDIVVIDTLVADNVLMVEMNAETIRLVDGMPITNIQWGSEGNMVSNYKVMTIQVPQIRSDDNGRTGLVHMA
jgi:hypothetical protein